MEDKINAGSKKENIQGTTNPADWLAYYQILIDDIKYAKQQQWRLAYYALLLFAAVVALSGYLDSKPSSTITLFIVKFFLAVSGTYYLRKFQRDIRRYRTNVSTIRNKYFPPDLRDIAQYEPADKDPYYYGDFLTLLVAVIWLSWFFVAWAIDFWRLLFC
jgi:hypothetical protein